MKYSQYAMQLTAITALLLLLTADAAAQRRFYGGRNHRDYYAYNYYRPARPVLSVNIGRSYGYRPYYSRPSVVYAAPHAFIHFGPAFGFRINVLPVGYYPFYIGADPYYYYEGVYYRPYNSGGYEVVKPPLGATVKRLPAGAKLTVIDGVKYYELGGTYYQEEINDKNKLRYKVVGTEGVLNTAPQQVIDEDAGAENNTPAATPPATTSKTAQQAPPDKLPEAGTKVDKLPEGCKTVVIKKEKYYLSPMGVYYQEVVEGNTVRYEVTGNSQPE